MGVMMNNFQLKSKFKPSGDQPKAIDQLLKGINDGFHRQTLLGVTGSGKTFTMANIINHIQRPTLVIAHNKTLAAQLCQEFREFFPNNAVEYFVSYYDYYQPEAYLPTTDTYIEKEAQINTEIERLRHASTQALLSRRDVIIVASVSCIYGIGSPETYQKVIIPLRVGEPLGRDHLIKRLIELQFQRNEVTLTPGTFHAKGDVIEIMPADKEVVYRVQFSDDVIEQLIVRDNLTARELERPKYIFVYPARHYIIESPNAQKAFVNIEKELNEHLQILRKKHKLLEADRLERRTKYDLAMMKEVGYCTGIENYSRHLSGRAAGIPPDVLLDYFPKDFLLIIDESHVTVPQIQGMFEGDKSRKETLINFGFRLPSAIDNRPLKWAEFQKYMTNVIFTSATPGPYELTNSDQIVEQIIRPTGLVDPQVTVKPTKNQVTDLIEEINMRVKNKQRVLITTLTKKMAEDLSNYLHQHDIKVRYLHSDIDTLARIEILRDLRKGTYDVIVGVNLLREGLDLPEVSLVAILDADKEGFLRSERSLIQTIGRAARHVSGKVILYADEMTKSLKKAIDETERRRQIQIKYNQKHHIEPKTIEKAIKAIVADEITHEIRLDDVEKELARGGNLDQMISQKEKEMKLAARELQFELAAILRDELIELRKMARKVSKNQFEI